MINVPHQKVGNVLNAKVPSNPKGKQERVIYHLHIVIIGGII